MASLASTRATKPRVSINPRASGPFISSCPLCRLRPADQAMLERNGACRQARRKLAEGARSVNATKGDGGEKRGGALWALSQRAGGRICGTRAVTADALD